MAQIINAVVKPHSGKNVLDIRSKVLTLVDSHLGQPGVRGTYFQPSLQTNAIQGMEIRVPLNLPVVAMLEFLSAFGNIDGIFRITSIPEPIWVSTVENMEEVIPWTFPTFGTAGTPDRLGDLNADGLTPVGGWAGRFLEFENQFYFWSLAHYGNIDKASNGPLVPPFTVDVTPAYQKLGAVWPGTGGFVPVAGQHTLPRLSMLTFLPNVSANNKGGSKTPLLIPDRSCRFTVNGDRKLLLKLNATFSIDGDDAGSPGFVTAPSLDPAVGDVVFFAGPCAILQGDNGAGPAGEDLISVFTMKRDNTGAFDPIATLNGTPI